MTGPRGVTVPEALARLEGWEASERRLRRLAGGAPAPGGPDQPATMSSVMRRYVLILSCRSGT